ncbi:MAG TPA: P1 family peptidase [Candidatus Acidoferrales bacterium]|nr:P1 family peptidase [Candidatus Acidoferrales bacterium]
MPPGFGPIDGLKVGHAQDERALTGCTVFIAEGGMTAACEVRGGATGTRELGVLDPGHIAGKIHALVFAGGSAFGLEAASGVVRWLEERGSGFDAGVARVPIVPAAILFDLAVGDAARRPDAEMGYQAAKAAGSGPVAEGNVGAGAGATVGKLCGIQQAMKAGIGCWTEECAGARGGTVRVAALAAVNAFGDVRDPATGRLLAGARRAPDSRELLDTAAALRRGETPAGFGQPGTAAGNTVLVAVAMDAEFDRLALQRVAAMASAGMARAITPAFTRFDGDIVFALSCGVRRAAIESAGTAAAEAVANAIIRGVTQARAAGGLPGLAG